MKYDARLDPEGTSKAEFVRWLVDTTAESFRRSRGDVEQLKAAMFLYLNRAYEARLDPDEIADLLASSSPNVLTSAGYSGADDEMALSIYEALDPLIEASFAGPTDAV